MTLPMKVLAATSNHAAANPMNPATAIVWNATRPVCAAKPLKRVMQVPTGKVNDHQVSENDRYSRTVRIVWIAAIEAHNSANPSTGTP